MNIPTQLTILRMLLAIVVLVAMLIPGWPAKLVAVVGFAVASLTDWFDGYLARKWNQTSSLGALLDPIADKVLTLGIFIVCVFLKIIPLWMVVLMVLREVGITAIRLVKARSGVILAAEIEGKWKTTLQIVAISFILVGEMLRVFHLTPFWSSVLHWVDFIIPIAYWMAFILTMYSGMTFFQRNGKCLWGRGKDAAG